MHKKVCGTRAVPFIWPGFSSYEIEDIWSFASKPYRSTGTSKPTSFQESAGRRLSPLIKEVMPDYALEVRPASPYGFRLLRVPLLYRSSLTLVAPWYRNKNGQVFRKSKELSALSEASLTKLESTIRCTPSQKIRSRPGSSMPPNEILSMR